MTDATTDGSKRPNVSIKDVAAAAGVSIATVSRVVNNPSLVAPSTAERVQAAVKQLGYRPNLFAKGLMTKRSRVLAVSLPDWQGDAYSELMRGADDRARELGYHLLVSTEVHNKLMDSGEQTSFALDLADGLIAMMTRSEARDAEAIGRLNKPVVLLGATVSEYAVDTLEVDNAAGAREATRHLLDGTRADRCFFVGGPEGSFDSDRRAGAFRDVVEATGHRIHEDQVNRGRFSFQWGWDWAGKALSSHGLAQAAVFAGNDEIAIGIMQRAREAGLECPRDLRLVGFDDSRTAGLLTPPLSSVRVPNRQIGAESVDVLVRRLSDSSAPVSHTSLPTQLVMRESSWY
ncbi:MAG: LacI family DNA-binding transcriptional regulator [Planctomycetota bacterium]